MKCQGAEEVDFELEADGSLLLSSLRSSWPSATGLSFVKGGRKRIVRVVADKLLPPKGGWAENVFEAILPGSSSEKKTTDAEVREQSTNEDGPSGSTKTKLKQRTLVGSGVGLALGPELEVQLQL